MKKIIICLLLLSAKLYCVGIDIDNIKINNSIEADIYQSILKKAEEAYPNNYDMQVFKVWQEVEAYKKIQNYKKEIGAVK